MKKSIFYATAFFTVLFFSCNKSSKNEIDSLGTARTEIVENAKPLIVVTNPDGTKTQHEMTRMPIDEKASSFFMRLAKEQGTLERENTDGGVSPVCCTAYIRPLGNGGFGVDGDYWTTSLGGDPYINIAITRYTQFNGVYYLSEYLSWESYTSTHYCEPYAYIGQVPCDGKRHAIAVTVFTGSWSYDTNNYCATSFLRIAPCY